VNPAIHISGDVAMSDSNSTTLAPSGKAAKPSKPSLEFPLTTHPFGQWCKKIRGKLDYFGPWDQPAKFALDAQASRA
jgi:hypothetical protein